MQASQYSAFDRVSVLSESMPYLQRFRGKTIVIKYGGAAMKDPALKARVVTDLVLLSTVGIRPVMVHGGGPEINIWLTKLGIEPVFKNGLRVTDGAPAPRAAACCLAASRAPPAAPPAPRRRPRSRPAPPRRPVLQPRRWTWLRWCWGRG